MKSLFQEKKKNTFAHVLDDRRVAILAEDGVNSSDLFSSKKVLEEAGAQVFIVSLQKGKIKLCKEGNTLKDETQSIQVDLTLNDCEAYDFDALVIPGNSADSSENRESRSRLMNEKKALEFVRDFADAGKSIASIRNGADLLIKTGAIKGRSVATWPFTKPIPLSDTWRWKDEAVVIHKGFVGSHFPQNPTFIKKMIESFSICPRTIHRKAM